MLSEQFQWHYEFVMLEGKRFPVILTLGSRKCHKNKNRKSAKILFSTNGADVVESYVGLFDQFKDEQSKLYVVNNYEFFWVTAPSYFLQAQDFELVPQLQNSTSTLGLNLTSLASLEQNQYQFPAKPLKISLN